MSTALPEVPEADATGETADIYEDIRQCLQVSNVNLIYRYFATIDGALPWVWKILRPNFASGQVAECARNSLSLYRFDFQCEDKLAVAPLTDVDREQISHTLDFYLKANPMNLFALELITKAVSLHGFDTESTQVPLLPITKIQEAANLRRFESVAHELMFYVSQGMESIRPTLIRQLAAWPHYVDSIADFVKAASLEDQFVYRTDSIYKHAADEASQFPLDNTTDSISAAAIADVGQFCSYFPKLLIRMTLIAGKLRLSL